MQENILRKSNVTKMFIEFADGKGIRRKENVSVRYMDNKYCFCIGPTTNFTKPKWRTKANIVVYTSDGVYRSTVIIRDVSFSLQNILYKIDIPKKWEFKQLRSGSRKKVKLPLTIRFNDGFEIMSETYDLSVGGFSFVGKYDLTTVHTRFACNCKLCFPKDNIINFPDGLLDKDCIYVRKKALTDDFEHSDQYLYCFKFTNITPEDSLVLKNFLLKIE